MTPAFQALLLLSVLAGPPDVAGIKTVIKDRRGELADCYDRWLEGLDSTPGERKVTVSFTIRQDGTAADIALSDLEGTPFAACVRASLGTWRFPPHTAPVALPIEYPLLLRPRSPETQPPPASSPP